MAHPRGTLKAERFLLLCRMVGDNSEIMPSEASPDSQDVTSPLLFPSPSSLLPLPLFNEVQNFGIKDACMLVLEHVVHEHQHIYVPDFYCKLCPPP